MRKKPLYKILSLLMVFTLLLGTVTFGLVPAYAAEITLPIGTSGAGVPLGAGTSTDITADFTDANFLAAVRIELGKDASDPIYDTDVSGLSSIDVSSKNISSLAGIQHFTSLTELYCQGNQLTTLDVSGLSSLTTLMCYENQLITLNFNGLTNLINLFCQENHLTTLDVSGLTNLFVLDCSSNQLTTLDVSGFTNLFVLDCSSNQLTTLKLSGLTSLTELYCFINQLTTLDVSGLTGLTMLNCLQNRLTAMNVQDLTALANFICCYNYMTSEAAIIGLNKVITTNFTYEPQHASDFKAVTNITGLPSEASVGIPLTLTGTVASSDATNQTIIWSIENANSTGASISGNTFTAMTAGTAYIKATITNGAAAMIDYTKTFGITVKEIVDITADFADSNFLAAVRSQLGKGASDPIYDIDVSGLKYLNVTSKNISSLAGIKHFTGLTELDCSGNQLTTLDMSGLANLMGLNCSGNQLTTLDVSGLINLIYLYCYENQLTTLEVNGLTNLTNLYCYENQLITLDVTGLTNLMSLHCQGNQLTILDVSGLTNLIGLNCSANQLTTLGVSGLTNLIGLHCHDNQLTILDVSGVTGLKTLNCFSNQLFILDMSGLTGLTYLDCSYNQLPVMNVQGLVALATINCHYNYMNSEAAVIGLNKVITTNFTFNPQHASDFKAVTNINGLPSVALVGIPLTLTGTVTPSDATNRTIVWKVQNAGTTGSTISGNTLSTTAAGSVTVKATIANGLTGSTDYAQDFNIMVNPAPMVDIDASISPTSASYDLNSPADVVTTITWNSASTVTYVVYGTTSLTTPDVYVVSGSALTIKSGYLNTLGISEGGEAKFKISFDKGNFVTLTVNIVDNYIPATNSELNGLTVNGNSVSGFDPNTTIYNVELPYGTASVSVGAIPEDAHATVAITQVQVLPGDATVVVTAEDKITTKSYIIHFTLEAAPTYHSITVQSDGNSTVSANVYSASKGTEITLTATPDSGYRFKGWQVVDGSVMITDNKFIMPEGNVTVKAIFEQIPLTVYQVTINGSYAATSGAGSHYPGDTVTINAGSRGSYTFNGWTSTDGITFANENSTATTFTMPAGNVTVTASWSYSGSIGNNTTDDSDSTEVQQETKPNQPMIGSASVKAKKGAGNSAIVEILEKTVANAIANAQAEATKQKKTENGIGVSLSVSSPAGTKSLGSVLAQPILTQLTKAEVSQFEIDGGLGTLKFDLEAIKEIQKQSTGDVTISITSVTGLYGDAKTLIGTRPVYNISISYVKDGKTVNITSLGNGSVTLAIPYTQGKKEAVGYLFGVYVNSKGKATRIDSSTYDANSKSIIFDSNHFSVYGVGYAVSSTKVTDITSHWAKESIDYVVGRGFFSSTSDTAFSPDTAMSRSMLVTVLGRLAGADMSGYKISSFTDVKTDGTFLPYIEWAYKKGIVQGISNNQFAPDRAVTREEIALILQNYAKTTGYTLPVTREAVTFADTDSIGSTFKDAVKVMQQAGIMIGGDGNKFNPKASTTRAEVSAMLHRYIKLTIDPTTAQGWAVNDAGQRLYYKDGRALTGWQNIGSGDSKKRYYFTEDTVMVSGKWLQIDEKWYYFNTDGSLAVENKSHLVIIIKKL